MWNREFGSRDLTALVPKSKKPVNNLTIATTKGWDITIGWTILLKIAQLTPKFHTQKKESNNYMRWQLKGTCHKTYESCFCWHILKILFAWLSWWSSYFKSLTQNIYTSTHCFYNGIYYIGIIYILLYIYIGITFLLVYLLWVSHSKHWSQWVSIRVRQISFSGGEQHQPQQFSYSRITLMETRISNSQIKGYVHIQGVTCYKRTGPCSES